MISGMYTAASALTARQKAQEVIAANLAGAGTLGYHRQDVAFTGFGTALYDASQSNLNGPSTSGGTAITAKTFDFQPGPLKTTGNALDLAINGPGFFVLQTPQGERLTRAGAFQRDPKGQLISETGDPVLGKNGPITVPVGEVTLRANGTLDVNGKECGQLRIEEPGHMQSLFSAGGGLFGVGAGDSTHAVEKPEVHSGMLQQSNVNIPQELVWMLENSRMNETAAKSLQTIDETMGKGIQDLGS